MICVREVDSFASQQMVLRILGCIKRIEIGSTVFQQWLTQWWGFFIVVLLETSYFVLSFLFCSRSSASCLSRCWAFLLKRNFVKCRESSHSHGMALIITFLHVDLSKTMLHHRLPFPLYICLVRAPKLFMELYAWVSLAACAEHIVSFYFSNSVGVVIWNFKTLTMKRIA